mmetsp:Transcript_3371/g.9418  ORF Transcript_3371/g.9418 Transcript_3371/m.9418 type:complete len:247 (-) Transcript_3371:42-782(-)
MGLDKYLGGKLNVSVQRLLGELHALHRVPQGLLVKPEIQVRGRSVAVSDVELRMGQAVLRNFCEEFRVRCDGGHVVTALLELCSLLVQGRERLPEVPRIPLHELSDKVNELPTKVLLPLLRVSPLLQLKVIQTVILLALALKCEVSFTQTLPILRTFIQHPILEELVAILEPSLPPQHLAWLHLTLLDTILEPLEIPRLGIAPVDLAPVRHASPRAPRAGQRWVLVLEGEREPSVILWREAFFFFF